VEVLKLKAYVHFVYKLWEISARIWDWATGHCYVDFCRGYLLTVTITEFSAIRQATVCPRLTLQNCMSTVIQALQCCNLQT